MALNDIIRELRLPMTEGILLAIRVKSILEHAVNEAHAYAQSNDIKKSLEKKGIVLKGLEQTYEEAFNYVVAEIKEISEYGEKKARELYGVNEDLKNKFGEKYQEVVDLFAIGAKETLIMPYAHISANVLLGKYVNEIQESTDEKRSKEDIKSNLDKK